MGKLTNKKI